MKAEFKRIPYINHHYPSKKMTAYTLFSIIFTLIVIVCMTLKMYIGLRLRNFEMEQWQLESGLEEYDG
jgi:hypothetical protein